MDEVFRSALEFVAVLLAAIGTGLVVGALVGGLLGAGLGVLACALVLFGAAEVSRLAHRPADESETP